MDQAFQTTAFACLGVIVICWVLGLITGEHSWVDRLWSILPVGYVVSFTVRTGFRDPRLVIMAIVVFGWGARLTYNFARKGGYQKGGEDYRWPVLRKKMRPWQWQLFAIFFIAGFQNVLLFLIALPAWMALRHAGKPLGMIDLAATALFVLFVVGETIADQQQWVFHLEKKAKTDRGEKMEPPFLTTGLFRFSRHPNFFCEQTIWWSLYLFSVGASGQWLSPTLLGPAILVGLFQGSTQFTEKITLTKYPEYADYQRRTSRLFPWWSSG